MNLERPDVVWRMLGGDAGTPADPDGWFLQRRDRPADWVTWVTAGTLPPVARLRP